MNKQIKRLYIYVGLLAIATAISMGALVYQASKILEIITNHANI
jgi:hypothetical protein